MRAQGWSVAAIAIGLSLVTHPGQVAAGLEERTQHPSPGPVFDVGLSESGQGVVLELEVLEGVLQGSGSPLARCDVRGPVPGSVVLELVGGVSRHSSVGVIIDEAQEYGLIVCVDPVLDGERLAAWPILKAPPPVVVEALIAAAVSSVDVVVPVVGSSPDGVGVPLLVGMPVWFWVDGGAWVSSSGSVALSGLGLSATAVLTPVGSVWDPGDGSAPVECGAGVVWEPGLEGEAGCSHTYAAVTGVGESLALELSVHYRVEVVCAPVDMCVGVDVPTSVVVRVSRPVVVTEARGVLTG